jgi:hypothetical protein
MRRTFLTTLYHQLGWGIGRLPINMGSGASMSFLRKNHTFCHQSEGPDIGTWK